jgi:hypothetical protein
MSSESNHIPQFPVSTGTSSLGWRFLPHVGTPGLDKRLKLRSFTGFHPEDTLQCRAAAWHTEEGLNVLLSPAPGLRAPALAYHFERLASLYFIELIARGAVRSAEVVKWVQHWPARAEAPAPHDTDRFERVLMTPWALPATGAPPARVTVSAAEALSGLLAEAASS